MKQLAVLRVNGRTHELAVQPDATLLDTLREQLGLTGARRGCETSYCGACTVLLDGQAVHSCCVLALGAVGCEVTTIEGLEQDGELHPVQRAFVEGAAIQCGYCTPGFVLSAVALLKEQPRPTEAEIRDSLTGNLCRCTGYVNIVGAVQRAAESLASAQAARA